MGTPCTGKSSSGRSGGYTPKSHQVRTRSSAIPRGRSGAQHAGSSLFGAPKVKMSFGVTTAKRRGY